MRNRVVVAIVTSITLFAFFVPFVPVQSNGSALCLFGYFCAFTTSTQTVYLSITAYYIRIAANYSSWDGYGVA